MELFTAVAALTGEDVACGTAGVHSHQHGFILLPLAFDEGDMFQSVALLTEGDDAEVSVSCWHISFHTFLHQALTLQTVGDEVFDLDEFQSKLLGLLDELGHTCHRTIGVEYLDEGSGRFQPCQTCQIDSCFRMSRAAQHTIVLRIKWIDVSRTSEVTRFRLWIRQPLDGGSTVVSAHSCRTAFQFVDGHRERCAQHGRVLFHLMG